MEWIKRLYANWKHMRETDPVYNCDVYLDKENGSCSHVDGYLCDMETCQILKDYRDSFFAHQRKNNEL